LNLEITLPRIFYFVKDNQGKIIFYFIAKKNTSALDKFKIPW